MYEFSEAYDRVRFVNYGATSAQFGGAFAVPGVARARLYWAGGATTYVVTLGGGGISIIELGPMGATPLGSFVVPLPSGVSCSGCTLSDLEIAQEAFPGYPPGRSSRSSPTRPPSALLRPS